jgi:hypothetical protein
MALLYYSFYLSIALLYYSFYDKKYRPPMFTSPQAHTPSELPDHPPMPKSHAGRTKSVLGFHANTSNNTAVSMRNELHKLTSKMTNEPAKKVFEMEMDCFFNLFTRFLAVFASHIRKNHPRPSLTGQRLKARRSSFHI